MPALAALRPLDGPSEEYLQFHERRYAFLLHVVADQAAPMAGPLRILDVGLSFQTPMLEEAYPQATVDTVGYFDYRFSGKLRGRHYDYDLNQAHQPATWPQVEPYDLVIMAEVIEHLHTAPTHILACAASWLRPGGILIIQTPNPISLGKRIAMLFGKSPFEMIREDSRNPGHFCEYTDGDLRRLATASGLEVRKSWLKSYFGPGGWMNALYAAVCTLLPGQLHDGITITLRKPHL